MSEHARILVVDDDARIRDLLESTPRFAGFDVVGDVDLVLLDVMPTPVRRADPHHRVHRRDAETVAATLTCYKKLTKRDILSVAPSARRPHNRDRYALCAGSVDDVRCSAGAARWFTVPDCKQLVRLGKHPQAGIHVCVRIRLDVIEANDFCGFRYQRVVAVVMLLRQTIAILTGRHDDVKLTAVVQYGSGEQGVCPVGEAADANQRAVLRTPADLLSESGVDQRGRLLGEPAVSSDRKMCHQKLIATAR